MNVGSGGGSAAPTAPTAAASGAAPETTKPEEKPEEKEEASSLLSIFCLVEANLSHRSLTKIWVSVYLISQLSYPTAMGLFHVIGVTGAKNRETADSSRESLHHSFLPLVFSDHQPSFSVSEIWS